MRPVFLLTAVLAVGGVLVLAGCRASRAGYESAPYEVIRSSGAFEIREYPVLRVAETTMKDGGSSGGFGRLFQFISGANQRGEKIAMTTPVFMEGGDTMAFVMPAGLRDVPQPGSGAVALREIPAGRFAVLRYSGARNPGHERQRLEELRAWADGQHLRVSATPVFAYFDPPWTPPPLRRNEVMLRIES